MQAHEQSTTTPGTGQDATADGHSTGYWIMSAAAVIAAAVGLAMIGLTALLGHCSAFGGTCPADPQPLWDNDVFGGVVAGSALVLLPGIIAWSDGRTKVIRRLAVAVPACLIMGLLAAAWANG